MFDDPMREPQSSPPSPGVVQPPPPPGAVHPLPPAPGQVYSQGAHVHPGFLPPGPMIPPSPPAKGGPVLGMMSLLLALVGLVYPFLPFNMDGYRQFIGFPLGAIGIVLGILGVVGLRRAKPLAAVGIGFSCLTLAVGFLFLLNYYVL